MDIVIVGSGPAGLHAALQCRQSWPQKSITLLEAEKAAGYCRPLLPQFMAGEAKEEKLVLFKPAEDRLLKVLTEVRVESIDREKQRLRLANGESIRYERLILAPGGRPIILRLEGAEALEGIFPVKVNPSESFSLSILSRVFSRSCIV